MRYLLPVAALALLAGCVHDRLPVRPAYYGPTDDLAGVVEKLNARNQRLVSFRGEGSYSADLIDPDTKKHTTADGPLTLLYTPPGNLRLSAKYFTKPVFDIGSNAQQYWLILPEQDQMFFGMHAAVATSRAARLPVRPDLLVEILGYTPLPADLLQSPAPALRFNNDQDCYMITWQILLPDRFAVQKEVWYDRQSLQPRLILLFDVNGRVVLRAYPSDPKPVDGYDPPLPVPSKYDLLFPATGSTFTIDLRDLERQRNGAPRPATFAFPQRPGVSKVDDLDR